jgi:exoribonuclease R
MSIYKIIVDNRNYTSWTIYETIHYKPFTEFEMNPIENKLFSNDFFKWNEEKKIEIVHSSIRSGTFIPGVLILQNNKTYGRKNGRLLYKCVPDDMRLPAFIVPYEIKKVGFTKIFLNMYVTFQFTSWEDKHPHGQLNQVIGEVDKLDNFYEYQLYCKSLNASIQQFQKDTMKSIQNKPHDAFIENIKKKYPSIEDRKDWFIFSIDPEKSLDFDDAFSIKKGEKGQDILSIYISNVTIWMDVLNLWDSFSRRISTIYLPDRKRPMLPTILSDCLCSLQSKNTRIALVMDIYMDNNYEIRDICFANCTVRVNRNFVYEEPDLLINEHYINLLEKTRGLSKKFKYLSSIRDSHDLVSYLMIFMNYHCAKEMMKHNNGIFRSTIVKKDFEVPPNKVPDDVGKFIKIWKSTSGQYIDGTELIKEQNLRHDLLDLDAYIHITSPIRRLVDLLNMIQLQKNLGLIMLSEKSHEFYKKWLNDLDYINMTMRSIRKVQMDCSLLDLCSNVPGTMEKEFDGYVFDKLERDDGLFQFIVFLPELKLSSRITMRDNVENYEKKKFHLYLFHDEESFKKKIRLHLL